MAAVDRFKTWAGSDKGKAFFRGKIERYGDRKWIEALYTAMCDWIADKNPNYKVWSRFAGSWIRRAYLKRADDVANSQLPGLMTASQEEDYYKKPREKPFVKIGDILSGKAEKENSRSS